jgi:hypothetical protein
LVQVNLKENPLEETRLRFLVLLVKVEKGVCCPERVLKDPGRIQAGVLNSLKTPKEPSQRTSASVSIVRKEDSKARQNSMSI